MFVNPGGGLPPFFLEMVVFLHGSQSETAISKPQNPKPPAKFSFTTSRRRRPPAVASTLYVVAPGMKLEPIQSGDPQPVVFFANQRSRIGSSPATHFLNRLHAVSHFTNQSTNRSFITQPIIDDHISKPFNSAISNRLIAQ